MWVCENHTLAHTHTTNRHRRSHTFSGCSAVRLAHLLWEQGVAGSNPATPTNEKGPDAEGVLVFFI